MQEIKLKIEKKYAHILKFSIKKKNNPCNNPQFTIYVCRFMLAKKKNESNAFDLNKF